MFFRDVHVKRKCCVR